MSEQSAVELLEEYQIKCGYINYEDEHRTYAERILKEMYPDCSQEQIDAEYKHIVSELDAIKDILPTPYQSPDEFLLLHDLFQRISDQANKVLNPSRVTFPHKLTYGTIRMGEFSAFVESGIRDRDYLIVISDGLFTFANLLSKSIGLLIKGNETEKNKIAYSYSKESIENSLKNCHEAIIRFVDLIMAYVITGDPAKSKQYTPKKELWPILSLIRDAFELFVVGHEYSHVLLGHLDDCEKAMQINLINIKDAQIESVVLEWSKEIEADCTASLLTILAMEGFDFVCSFIGVDICLITLYMLEQISFKLMGQEVTHKSHPPGEVRREVVYNLLLEYNKDITTIFETNTYVMNELWERCMYILGKFDDVVKKIGFTSILDIKEYSVIQKLLYRVGDGLLDKYDTEHNGCNE